jgi:ATP-binding cassette subfamily B protein
MNMEERTRLYIERHILRLVGGLPGLEHHERPEYANEVELLRGAQGTLAQPAGPIVFLFQLAITGGATLVLLARVHPLLLLLPLFGLPALVAGGVSARISRKASENTIERVRLTAVLFWTATNAVPGKEMRIFGLGRELTRRIMRSQREVQHERTIASAKGTALGIAGSLVFAAGYIGAVAFIAQRATHGKATLGDVLLTLTLAGTINGLVADASTMLQWLGNVMKIASRYIWLIDYAADAAVPIADPVPAPTSLTQGVKFKSVRFRYPGTDIDVLDGVNLTIRPGSTVAIVGDNGAGKTTLVKLLCRFYEPSAGTITVDGIELQRIPIVEWRSQIASGFQDFSKFEFIAGETIGVGDLTSINDSEHVLAALDRSHGRDVIDSLPDGLATQLGKQFDDGHELSGGQWQKLALGRAMMRDNPLVLLLDEPTASLDAQTEHALFERYAAGATRAANKTGAITILVSHRFSTVRMADLILVVEDGRISEAGTHDELIATGGTYHELYNIQASAYR